MEGQMTAHNVNANVQAEQPYVMQDSAAIDMTGLVSSEGIQDSGADNSAYVSQSCLVNIPSINSE